MGYDLNVKDSQQVQDNINPTSDVVPILKRGSDTIVLEEGPTIVKTQDIGNSFIIGHSTNGVLGDTTGGGGEQIILGDDSGVEVFKSVSSPNNTFREHFRFTDFEDSSGTATWDTTTNFRINFTSGQVGLFKSVYLDSNDNPNNITSFTLSWNDTGTITGEVSLDGGGEWHTVTNGTLVIAESGVTIAPGNNAIIKFTESVGSTGTVSEVKFNYTIS